MAYLKLIPPTEVTPGALAKLLAEIEHAVNFMDSRNFPNGIPGSLVNAGTLGGAALKDWDVPLKKLVLPKWYIPLSLPAAAFTTTSTTGVDVGPYFRWIPGDWPAGTWTLEGTIYVADSAATATLELVGAATIGSVSTDQTAATRVVSGALAMPTAEQNIWLKLKTSNASYAAGFLGARLIFAPS